MSNLLQQIQNGEIEPIFALKKFKEMEKQYKEFEKAIKEHLYSGLDGYGDKELEDIGIKRVTRGTIDYSKNKQVERMSLELKNMKDKIKKATKSGEDFIDADGQVFAPCPEKFSVSYRVSQ